MTALRKVGALCAIATLGSSGIYVFVYLYRWEWNRALVSGVIFVATEVGVVTWLLMNRLHRIERRLDLADQAAADRRAEILRSTAPPPRVGFAWLTKQDQLNVFVPVLLGAGALMSALAWVVERLARSTAGRVAEHGLAARLGALELPRGGLLDTGPDPYALLRGPRRNGG